MELTKKVLMVSCEGLGRGGVQSIMMTIKRNVKNCKIDMLLFTDEIRYYDNEVVQLNGVIHRIPLKKGTGFQKIIYKFTNQIKTYFFMNKLLKTYHYDIIHCNNEVDAWIPLLVAKKRKIPIRISHHHRSNYLNKKSFFFKSFFKIFAKKILKLSTSIICCSQKTKDDFFGEINSPKIKIIVNPIDIEKFSTNKIEHMGIQLSNVGSYSKVKNQLFLLDVMKVLMTKNQNVSLNLVGFGDEYRKKLEHKIKEYNLNNKVNLIDGTQPDAVVNTLKITDIFLFPSLQEGFGISLIEAQAMNIMCLSSPNVPIETDVGLVEYIDISNPQVWADKILEVLKSNDKVLNLNKIKKYSVESFVKKIENEYEI